MTLLVTLAVAAADEGPRLLLEAVCGPLLRLLRSAHPLAGGCERVLAAEAFAAIVRHAAARADAARSAAEDAEAATAHAAEVLAARDSTRPARPHAGHQGAPGSCAVCLAGREAAAASAARLARVSACVSDVIRGALSDTAAVARLKELVTTGDWTASAGGAQTGARDLLDMLEGGADGVLPPVMQARAAPRRLRALACLGRACADLID